jgi:hypothetical protein
MCLIMFSGCRREEMELRQIVPGEFGGWKVVDAGQVYDRDSLFDYINGGAELYLAYGFREMVACRFQREGQPDIVADVFDMGSSEDAFGVFSAERLEAEVGIGQGSEYAAGLLRFWKGPFFVSVWAEQETAEAESCVPALGAAIAEAIEPVGRRPQLLDLLPEQDLAETGVRYFHNHASLNLHYFLADDNLLNMSQRTEAVLAPYRISGDAVRLLLVRYTAAEEARDALGRFIGAYLPEARNTGVAQVESGRWVAARIQGNVTMVVFDSPARRQAVDLLEAVRTRLEDGVP